jgi:hypothetical protein
MTLTKENSLTAHTPLIIIYRSTVTLNLLRKWHLFQQVLIYFHKINIFASHVNNVCWKLCALLCRSISLAIKRRMGYVFYSRTACIIVFSKR